MRKIAFTKMEGCGNDYVYLDGFSEDLRLAEGDIPSLARAVSDRHYGVGSDGLVLILPPTSPDSADLRMRMFNADGSEAEMCGNASRCVGRFAWEHALTDRPVIRLETLAGVKLLQRVDDAGGCPSRVCVDMGTPELARQRIPVRPDTTSDPESPCIGQPIRVLDREWAVTCVSMGNPHAITYIDDVKNLEIEKIGPKFENHEIFPDRVNTEFVRVVDRNTVEMRVWERGSGETLACGTGACAVAVSSILNGLTEEEVTVKLLGGDLKIFWDRTENKVYMTGSATTVFDGEIDL
mgnify:CR=1 FL=1